MCTTTRNANGRGSLNRRKRQRVSPMGLNVLLLASHILLKREKNEPSEFKCESYETMSKLSFV